MDEKKRMNKVCVFLTDAETAGLDDRRGKMRRSACLRACLTNSVPPVIPPLNLHAWIDLGRALGNLATLSGMSRSGQYVDIGEARAAVNTLRAALIGASAAGGDDNNG